LQKKKRKGGPALASLRNKEKGRRCSCTGSGIAAGGGENPASIACFCENSEKEAMPLKAKKLVLGCEKRRRSEGFHASPSSEEHWLHHHQALCGTRGTLSWEESATASKEGAGQQNRLNGGSLCRTNASNAMRREAQKSASKEGGASPYLESSRRRGKLCRKKRNRSSKEKGGKDPS